MSSSTMKNRVGISFLQPAFNLCGGYNQGQRGKAKTLALPPTGVGNHYDKYGPVGIKFCFP